MRGVLSASLALAAMLFVHYAAAQRVIEQQIPPPNFSKTPSDCKTAAQAVWCYYDSSRTAIVGLAYQPRASSFSRRVCNTENAPGTFFTLRPTVGIRQVESTTCQGRVVRLAFKLTNGNTAVCNARGSTCCWRGETCSSKAKVKVWTDPVQIFVGPTTPSKRPYWLAGMDGTCNKVTQSLQKLSDVCWVEPPGTKPPAPSPRPPSPSPRPPPPSPSPSPSPPPPPPSPPPAAITGQLAVTLFARGQSSCSTLSATTSLTNWLNNQLVMLEMADYRVSWDDTSCSCSLDANQQDTPMYRCLFSVKGPQLSYLNATEVAPYLADVIAASGQQFCSSAPVVPGFCGGVPAITGYCAAAPSVAAAASGGMPLPPLTCELLPVPQPVSLQASLAVQGASCNRSRVLSAVEADSLVSYMGGFVPGFSISLSAPNSPMTCSRGQGNAYYSVPFRLTAGIRTDVKGAASYLITTLNSNQPVPCQVPFSSTSNPPQPPSIVPDAPAFCSGFGPTQPPVLCATSTISAEPFECSGAGASFAVVFSNPDDSCVSNPPPPEYGTSLDPWWRAQLDSFGAQGKACRATTVLPGTATPNTEKNYCNYNYRVLVTGPNELTAEQVGDMALTLMSAVFYYRPVPCVYWGPFAFCQYYKNATFCTATPYLADYPLECSPEPPADKSNQAASVSGGAGSGGSSSSSSP